MSGLDRLPARRPVALLEDLESLAVRRRAGEAVVLPRITLLLMGGHRVAGRFVAYDSRGREAGGVVLDTSESRGQLDATYAALDSVVAVTVHHEVATVAALSGGRIAPPPVDAPGKLAIERSLIELRAQATALLGRETAIAVDWDALGTADFARAAVGQALTALQATLASVAADELGRTAFVERVTTIRIAPGSPRGAILDAGELKVQLESDGEQVFAPSAEALRRAVEGLL